MNRDAGDNSILYNADSPETLARGDYAANLGPETAGVVTQWFAGPNPNRLGSGTAFRSGLFELIHGVCFQRSEIALKHVSDGTSHTYMVGEKYLDPLHYASGENFGDDQSAWCGDDLDLHRYTDERAAPARDQPALELLFSFGSAHPGGMQMSLCDASVRTVSYEVDPDVHYAFGTRNKREVVSDSGL